jgi:hypothetical protein
MEVRALSADDLDTWQDYFERLVEAGPYHDPTYVSTVATWVEGPSAEPELLVLDDGDGFVYYPRIVRSLSDLPFADANGLDATEHYDAISSWYYGGPLLGGSDPDPDLPERFVDALERHSREHDVVSEFVRFDPNRENHAAFEAMSPDHSLDTVRVDLTQSEEAIWDDFERRNRNAIRQAQDTDLEVEPTSDPDEYEAFYGIYRAAMEAKDAGERYRFDYEFFEELLGRPDLASLVVARYDGEVVGGSMLVHDDRVAHDYLRASEPDYWDMRVNNLLCYGSLTHMRDTGRELFDFQGGRPGVFKFKRGFTRSGRGQFHVAENVYLPDVYEALVEAAGVDATTDFFPAYRA